MKKLFIVLLVLLAIVGCKSADKFPTEVSHEKGQPAVESLEAFVNARAEVLLKSANDYLRFANLITTTHKVPEDIYVSGKYIGIENKNTTRTIVAKFAQSSQGAYLSDQDEDYITRLIDEKIDQVNKVIEEANAVVTKKSEEDEKFLVTPYWAKHFFFGGALAKEEINKKDFKLYTDIAADIKRLMLKDSREELWAAYRDHDTVYLDNYRADDKNPSIFTFVNRAVENIVAKNQNTNEVSDVEVRRFFYTQLFQAVPFDQVLTVVDQTGYNVYSGFNGDFDNWKSIVANALKKVDEPTELEKT